MSWILRGFEAVENELNSERGRGEKGSWFSVVLMHA